MQRTTIVRKGGRIGKARLHDLLMVGWQRCVAKFGREAFADELEISTEALRKQLSGSMPDFSTIVAAYCIDDDVLSEVLDALGVRIVPKEAACDVDDLNVLMARALVKINEATHPDGPGGRTITHSEYLDGELVMRQIHKASGAWVEQCAVIRGHRSVA